MHFSILLIILILVFCSTFIATYAVVTRWNLKQKVQERVKKSEEKVISLILRQEEIPGFFGTKILGWLSLTGRWGLQDQERTSKVRADLIKAGYRQPMAPAIYFGLRALFAFLVPVPLLLLIIIKAQVSVIALLWAFSLSLFGFFLPTYILKRRIDQRQSRIDKALPDVLDLFVICMEAGLSLNLSVNRVSREIEEVHKDFHDELQITAAELRTGIPWDEAFENLGKRTGVQSLRSMIALLIQSDRMGTTLAQAFRTQSDFSREQRALRSEERAAKLPIKMIFPLALLILPVMFIITIGPAIIQIKAMLPMFQR